MTSGTIVKWHKKPGDALNPGDLVAEVATDKATVDFECQDSGYLAQILVPESTSDVTVGKLIAIMVDTPEAVAAFANTTAESFGGAASAAAPAPPAPKAAAPAPSPASAPAPAPAPVSTPSAAPSASAASGGRVVASPLAKKLAADAGVALAAVGAGTGPGGRVIAADVKEFLAAGGAAKAAASTAAAATTTAAPAAVPQAATASVSAPVATGAYTDIPHTQMRRVIAHRLTLSKQTVPHYTLTSEITLDSLLALRASLNADLPADGKLSVNDFLIKASALALRKVPEVNSSWLEHAIRAYDYVDVSVAVAVPDGLITPIVKDADKKGLAAISTSVKSLVDKAKAKKLAPADFQGGTFTISNLGMFGIKQFSAIINPPQAAILAVGAAEKRVMPDTAPDAGKGAYKHAVVMAATLSCDHRVVDGAVGAQWLAAFKGYLENPNTMLL